MSDGPSSLRIGSLNADRKRSPLITHLLGNRFKGMRNFLPRIVSPTALLYVYVTFTQITNGIYFAGNIEPPPGFSAIYRLGFLWIVGWWLLTDSRKRGVALVYDIGMFLYIAWPLIMPYYLVTTRRAKGLLLIFAFVSIYIGAAVVGMALYLLLATA